jgi:hypothetical protein
MGSMGKSSTRRQSDILGFYPIFSDCPSSVSWLTLVVGSVHLFRKEGVWKSRCSIRRPLQSIRSSPMIDIVSVTSVNLSVCRVLSWISLTCKYRFSRRLLPCFFLILGFWRRVDVFVDAEVSEKHTIVLYRPSISLPCHFSPGRWRQYFSPKRRHRQTHQHGAKTQN